jgi:hypothetical protein
MAAAFPIEAAPITDAASKASENTLISKSPGLAAPPQFVFLFKSVQGRSVRNVNLSPLFPWLTNIR